MGPYTAAIMLLSIVAWAPVADATPAAGAACYAAAQAAWAACMAGAVAGTAGFPAIAAACYATWQGSMAACAGVALAACFEDNVFMTTIVDSSACILTHEQESGIFSPEYEKELKSFRGECTRQTRVRDVRVGDVVLTRNLDGEDVATTVVWNKRHESESTHMNITIETANGPRSLVLTTDHVMVANGHLPNPSLVKAADLTVGERVVVQGEVCGVVADVAPVVLNHKNDLVTSAGTVYANGIQVTTICADALPTSTDARTVLSTWQKEHAFLGELAQPVSDVQLLDGIKELNATFVAVGAKMVGYV